MEFGLFVQAHVPRQEVEADPGGAEHARLLREVELAEAADRHEFKGFGIPDGDTTRAMFDEALREILRMWRETPYGYDGRFFSMPPRNVLPKPWTRPHPPLWMACGSPSTFEKAARLGVGALCFSLGTPRDFEPLIR